MAMSGNFYNIENNNLSLSGEWILENAAVIITQVENGNLDKVSHIDATTVARMDSWGAFYLKKIISEKNAAPKLTETQQKLIDFLPARAVSSSSTKRRGSLHDTIETVGKNAVAAREEIFGLVSFIGQTSVRLIKNIGSPKSFRFHSIVRHIEETGLRAVPIISLLAILTTMVVSYQAATQLQKFGANIFTIDLTVISLLREMGVLITAIMVAGRSGSAFAAEIGVMKLREEVDALRTMGMDPFEVLVLPRVLALMISLPILTFIANMVGLTGGGIISMALLDIPIDQYIDRVQKVATPAMFFVGMIKAPVFAFIIAIVGTYQGMNISGSAESVGKLTTVSVVQSIFLVILADAFFSIIFAQLDI